MCVCLCVDFAYENDICAPRPILPKDKCQIFNMCAASCPRAFTYICQSVCPCVCLSGCHSDICRNLLFAGMCLFQSLRNSSASTATVIPAFITVIYVFLYFNVIPVLQCLFSPQHSCECSCCFADFNI